MGSAHDIYYVYDFVRAGEHAVTEDSGFGAWTKFSFPDTVALTRLTVHDDELYGIGDTGKLYKLNSGTNDAGNAINSYYKTAAIGGEKEHVKFPKTWRRLLLNAELSGAWNLTVSYYSDNESSSFGSTTVSLTPGTDQTRKVFKINLPSKTSKFIQFYFQTNAVDNYFKIHELEVFYHLRGLR